MRRSGRRRSAVVEELVVAAPTHPGGRRLLVLGCLDVDAPESHPERLLEVLLAPLSPVRQATVVPGVRVDFLLADLGVVVEYDGSDHESGRARRRDARRDERIRRETGLVVVRITRVELRDPPGVLAKVLAAASCR